MEGVIALVFLVFLYISPTIVAEKRKHRNSSAILVLNLLLGWTILGWVIALIWALTDNVRPEKLSELIQVPGTKKLK